MEEVLIPDVVINNTKYKVGEKIYGFYCKRPTKASAGAIRDDLKQNGCDAVLRRAIMNRHECFEVWWRKDGK